MFDENLHDPLLGTPNEVCLKYDRTTENIIIIWPDQTQYMLSPNLLAQYTTIQNELKRLDITKKYIISDNEYDRIIYNEFQDLMAYFGLLSIDFSNNSNTSSFDTIYIGTESDAICITYPHVTIDYDCQIIKETISNNGQLMSKNQYQELKRNIQKRNNLQTILPILNPFIERKYPQLQTLKRFFQHQPLVNPKDIEEIQHYKDVMLTIDENTPLDKPNDKDVEKLISGTRKLHQVIGRFQKNNADFLQNAQGYYTDTRQTPEHQKIKRFFALMVHLHQHPSMQPSIQRLVKALNLNPQHFETYMAQIHGTSTPAPEKPISKKPVSNSLPPLKKSNDVQTPASELVNQYRLSEDSHWFDDKEIQDMGNELLKSIRCPKTEYTFIHNAVDIKDHPTALFQYAQSFKLSNQRYGFYALNLNESHWVYVLIYRDNQSRVMAHCINSMSEAPYANSCQALRRQFEELNIPLQFSHLNIQNDGYNCGVWVLHFLQKTIEHIASSPNIQIQRLLNDISKPINIHEKRNAFKQLIAPQTITTKMRPSTIQKDLVCVDAIAKTIHQMNAQQIQNWAIRKRQQKDVKQLSHDDLLEAISYMDQCYYLSSQGNRLRNTQKLAILAFLNNQNNGHIAQINTGEGKTIIVACVQAINVIFNRYKGHVFTSNSVLAEDGVKNNQSFFDILNISVAHNNADPNYADGPRACYAADIVYGTISNFQFDWLRHEFECQNTMGKDFNFDECWVMLDEIDSLLVDQGGNLAKLSTPFPGMADLQLVYLTIWESLIHLDKEKDNDAHQVYQHFIKGESKHIIREKIQQLIVQGQVAKHLESYIESQYSLWLDSAFAAKYCYQKDVEYNMMTKDGISTIIPIDNHHTGVFMHNTVLSHGLHQFLQLKHALPLSFESPTSSFVSNIGFVTKYGHKVSGVTGTMGGEAEQELLNKKIKLQYSIIPPFRPKNFQLYPGQIFNDEHFLYQVAHATLDELKDDAHKNKKKRAVLIICSSIKDVDALHDTLIHLAKENQLSAPKIKLYRDESEATITEDALDLGDIVIATNLSGRGTDFHTTDALESHGGLHVIEAFLPANQRVQDQGFGRTSRQGKAGTGQLIIRNSEIKHFGLEDGFEFSEVLLARDHFETERLEDIKSEKIQELTYQDALFECFSQFYQQLKKQHERDTDPKWRYILKDLKEQWAIWLIQHADTSVSIHHIEKHFESFKQLAQPIIQGEICHNPYYVIQLVQNYLSKSPSDFRQNAKRELARLMNKSQGFDPSHLNADLCYQLYIYLFEISIDEGGQLLQRFKEAIASLFNYPFTPNHDYLIEAKSFLEKAKVGLQLKINELMKWLESVDNKPARIACIMESAEFFKTEHNLCQYLQSKLNVYQLHFNNIESLIEQTTTYRNGAILEKGEKHLLKFVEPKQAQHGEPTLKILKSTVSELHSEGNSAIYELKPVYPVENKVLNNAKYQIGGGMATLGFAAYFPWTLSFLGPLAGAMISEGIMDILMNLMNHSEFNQTEYHQAKIITYSIALATMGLGVIFKCTKIVSKIADYLRTVAARLDKSTSLFSGVYKQVGRLLNRLADYLDRMAYAVASKANRQMIAAKDANKANFKQIHQFNKMDKIKPVPVLDYAKNGVKNGVKNVVVNQLKNRAMIPFLKFIMKFLKPYLEKTISAEFKKHETELRLYSKEHLSAAIKKLFDKSELNKNLILRKITFGITKKLNASWPVNAAIFSIESIIARIEIELFAQNMRETLCSHLSAFPKQSTPLADAEFAPILKSLCDKLTEQLYSKITTLMQNLILDTPQLIKDGNKYYKQKQADDAEIEALMDAAEFQTAVSDEFFSLPDDSDYQSVDSFDSIPEPQNRGLGFFDDTRRSSMDYFYNYQPNGLENILKIRLQSKLGETMPVVILPHIKLPYHQIQSHIHTVNKHGNAEYYCLPILIPQNRVVNHWVGMVWKQDDQHIHGFYVDSENQKMPEAIQQIFETLMNHCYPNKTCHLEAIQVPNQRYHNCGLELIENMACIITGVREKEDDVLEHHQELVLQETLLREFRLSR